VSGDPLWYYKHRDGFLPFAVRLIAACEKQLAFEAEIFHTLPEPEVEEATQLIPDDPNADAWDEMQMFRGILARHGVATACHTYPRRRMGDVPVEGRSDMTKTVELEPEHPVNAWLRSVSDEVILGLIRENPLWLRSPAIADRLAQHRERLNRGDRNSRRFLQRLASPSPVPGRGRPSGPRIVSAASVRQWALSNYERQARDVRTVWLTLRAENPDDRLGDLGRRFVQHLKGWRDPEALERWTKRMRRPPPFSELTEPQLLRHFADALPIVKDRDDKNYVRIDEDTWPRARSLALLAARWRVSKRWLRRGLKAPGQ
jgi:hypothetical protein